MCSNALFYMCDIMSLYKYFAVQDKLPCLTGSLSLLLSSSAIAAANGEVTKIIDSENEKIMKNC